MKLTLLSLMLGLVVMNNVQAGPVLLSPGAAKLLKEIHEERARKHKEKCDQTLIEAEKGYNQDIFVTSAGCVDNLELNLKMMRSGLVDLNKLGLDSDGKRNYPLEAAIENPLFFKELIKAGADANRMELFNKFTDYGLNERVNLIDVSQLTKETVDKILESNYRYQIVNYPEFIIKLLKTKERPKHAALKFLGTLISSEKHSSLKKVMKEFKINVNERIKKDENSASVPVWAYIYIHHPHTYSHDHLYYYYKNDSYLAIHDEFMKQKVIFDKNSVELAVSSMVRALPYKISAPEDHSRLTKEITKLAKKGGDFSEAVNFLQKQIIKYRENIVEFGYDLHQDIIEFENLIKILE